MLWENRLSLKNPSDFQLDRKIGDLLGKLRDRGVDTTRYIVEQVLDELGYRRRSFKKDLPMRTVEGRDAQFKKIEEVRKVCAEKGIPVFSIDTKKKELIGNFKRSGQVLCQGIPKAYDHDFPTFADAQIVPHGILDTLNKLCKTKTIDSPYLANKIIRQLE